MKSIRQLSAFAALGATWLATGAAQASGVGPGGGGGLPGVGTVKDMLQSSLTGDIPYIVILTAVVVAGTSAAFGGLQALAKVLMPTLIGSGIVAMAGSIPGMLGASGALI